MLNLLEKWLPVNASAHGPGLDSMTALVHWLMALLFVGWGIYFVVVLLKFRGGKSAVANYQGTKSHWSTYGEIGVVAFEALILVGFAIPAWAKWVTPHPADEDPLMVRVVGEQFAWNVHYPGADKVFGSTRIDLVDASNPVGLDRGDPYGRDDIVAINQLHLPVDRPVTIELSSKDVIHSFALPVMRVKQDAIPGMTIPVHFKPVMTSDDERWEIACAQLCGLGHYRMRGFLTVETEEEFAAWLAERAPQPAEPEAVEPEPAEPEAEAVATEPAATS